MGAVLKGEPCKNGWRLAFKTTSLGGYIRCKFLKNGLFHEPPVYNFFHLARTVIFTTPLQDFCPIILPDASMRIPFCFSNVLL